jgi:hypothetical protein
MASSSGEATSLEAIFQSLRSAGSVSHYSLKKDMLTKTAPKIEAFVKTVKVYSRHHKDKVVTVGDLVLPFNVDGYADCPEKDVSLVELLMAFQPGQFEFVAEPAAQEAVVEDSVVTEEPVTEDVVTDETVTDESPASAKKSKKKV